MARDVEARVESPEGAKAEADPIKKERTAMVFMASASLVDVHTGKK